jgi:hypothetical protein
MIMCKYLLEILLFSYYIITKEEKLLHVLSLVPMIKYLVQLFHSQFEDFEKKIHVL